MQRVLIAMGAQPAEFEEAGEAAEPGAADAAAPANGLPEEPAPPLPPGDGDDMDVNMDAGAWLPQYSYGGCAGTINGAHQLHLCEAGHRGRSGDAGGGNDGEATLMGFVALQMMTQPHTRQRPPDSLLQQSLPPVAASRRKESAAASARQMPATATGRCQQNRQRTETKTGRRTETAAGGTATGGPDDGRDRTTQHGCTWLHLSILLHIMSGCRNTGSLNARRDAVYTVSSVNAGRSAGTRRRRGGTKRTEIGIEIGSGGRRRAIRSTATGIVTSTNTSGTSTSC